jgi:hypothetical protein
MAASWAKKTPSLFKLRAKIAAILYLRGMMHSPAKCRYLNGDDKGIQ